jgi:hypothetical protein
MTVGLIMQFDGVSAEQYDQVMRELGLALHDDSGANWPQAIISHVAGGDQAADGPWLTSGSPRRRSTSSSTTDSAATPRHWHEAGHALCCEQPSPRRHIISLRTRRCGQEGRPANRRHGRPSMPRSARSCRRSGPRSASSRSCFDLDVVDIECDEDRIGERPAAGSSWAHTSACGKDESSEVSVVTAVVSGVRPPADWLGNVVLAADQAGSVHVEGLSWGVGVDVRRKADL